MAQPHTGSLPPPIKAAFGINITVSIHNRSKMCVRSSLAVKGEASPSGNRTPVSRVTGGDTHHYTNEDWLREGLNNLQLLLDYPLILGRLYGEQGSIVLPRHRLPGNLVFIMQGSVV